MSPLLYACVITGLGISNSRQGKEREVVLHKIIFVAHSVAQIGAKTAQNTPFRCSTVYRKLLICFRWGYYLANFKTAAFSQLGHSSAVNCTLNLSITLRPGFLRCAR